MSRDLRKYQSQTSFRLVVGFILLLVIVGGGLIWYFYGPGAALTGLMCLAAALLPVLLIWLILTGLDRVVKKARED